MIPLALLPDEKERQTYALLIGLPLDHGCSGTVEFIVRLIENHTPYAEHFAISLDYLETEELALLLTQILSQAAKGNSLATHMVRCILDTGRVQRSDIAPAGLLYPDNPLWAVSLTFYEDGWLEVPIEAIWLHPESIIQFVQALRAPEHPVHGHLLRHFPVLIQMPSLTAFLVYLRTNFN